MMTNPKQSRSARFRKKLLLLPAPYSELKAAGVLEEPAKQAIKEAVAKAKARTREPDGVAAMRQQWPSRHVSGYPQEWLRRRVLPYVMR